MRYLAIYLRLSREDMRCEAEITEKRESNSISNQRKLIYEYIQKDLELSKIDIKEFCDDGFSGTNMERPGMISLLDAIKENKIRCIIVKDMSRFSRDYIKMGIYLSRIFPEKRIRFIAVNDHYDSSKTDESGKTVEADTVFRTLLYDLYSKDISLKVKSALEVKCAGGEYVFGQVPFGYEKSKVSKNEVIVNEEEAKIVRYIFLLAEKGLGSTEIARRLYKENIPTIQQMRNKSKCLEPNRWGVGAVRKVLNNRFYLGEMAYGKTRRAEVGSKKTVYIPKNEWKIIKGHHEALITEEIYQKVSSFRKGYPAKRKKHPLTGKLICGGCGYSMSMKPVSEKNKYASFECQKYALWHIPSCCTYLQAERIEKIVLYCLNLTFTIEGEAEKYWDCIYSGMKQYRLCLEKKKKEYEDKKDSFYEKYATKKITKEEYRIKREELNKKIIGIAENERQITEKIKECENSCGKGKEHDYLWIRELNKKAAGLFIKRIIVYREKEVEIEWTFRFFDFWCH